MRPKYHITKNMSALHFRTLNYPTPRLYNLTFYVEQNFLVLIYHGSWSLRWKPKWCPWENYLKPYTYKKHIEENKCIHTNDY